MHSPLEYLMGSWNGPEAEEGLLYESLYQEGRWLEGKKAWGDVLGDKETMQTLPPDHKQCKRKVSCIVTHIVLWLLAQIGLQEDISSSDVDLRL